MKLIALLCLLWLFVLSLVATISNGNDQYCLVLPYISTFDDFRVDKLQDNQQGRIFSVYLRFKVNYDYTAEISNLTYANDQLFSTNATRVRVLANEKDQHVTYTSLNYPDPLDRGGGRRHSTFTKADAFRETKRIYDKLRLQNRTARFGEVAPPCSPVYIYESDLIYRKKTWDMPQSRFYQHQKFHRFTSCEKSIEFRAPYKGPLITSHNDYEVARGELRYSSIVAAAYSEWLVVYADANGGIRVDELTEQRIAKRPPLAVSLTFKPGKLANQSGDVGSAILNSSACYRRLHEVNIETPESYWDFLSSKPYRSVTQGFKASDVEGSEILVAEAERLKLVRYYTNSAGKRRRVDWPLRGVFISNEFWNKTAPFFVSSMAIFHNENLTRIQAIFRRPALTTHLFYVNSELRSDYSIRDNAIKIKANQVAEPDDITYWSSCKRIVSFFGFMYTTHHYAANIFTEESKWHILSERLFDYPIEAVHAKGDEFYFFTKATTVYRMSADSSFSCSKLKFRDKVEMHVSEFFGFKLKQFHTGDRYFSTELDAWKPSWDSYESSRTTASQETTSSPPKPLADSDESSLWMYVGLSLLAVLILLVAVGLVYMVKYRKQRSPPSAQRH